MMLAKDVCRPTVKNGNIDFRFITSNIDECPSSLKKGIFAAYIPRRRLRTPKQARSGSTLSPTAGSAPERHCARGCRRYNLIKIAGRTCYEPCGWLD